MAHRKVNKHFYVISTVQKKKWSEYDYEFYVDASFRKFQQPGHDLCTYSAYSFLIIDGNGIKNIFLSEKFSNIIKSAGKAEVVGIYNVIQYIKKHKKTFKGKKIIIYCDCKNAVDIINNLGVINNLGILKDTISVEQRTRKTNYIKIADKMAKIMSTRNKGHLKRAEKRLTNLGITRKPEVIKKSKTEFYNI